jgi:hypothetical protein
MRLPSSFVKIFDFFPPEHGSDLQFGACNLLFAAYAFLTAPVYPAWVSSCKKSCTIKSLLILPQQ